MVGGWRVAVGGVGGFGWQIMMAIDEECDSANVYGKFCRNLTLHR